jgi:hypothetical protein
MAVRAGHVRYKRNGLRTIFSKKGQHDDSWYFPSMSIDLDATDAGLQDVPLTDTRRDMLNWLWRCSIVPDPTTAARQIEVLPVRSLTRPPVPQSIRDTTTGIRQGLAKIERALMHTKYDGVRFATANLLRKELDAFARQHLLPQCRTTPQEQQGVPDRDEDAATTSLSLHSRGDRRCEDAVATICRCPGNPFSSALFGDAIRSTILPVSTASALAGLSAHIARQRGVDAENLAMASL